MEYIIASLMAAFSFLVNKFFIKKWGTPVIVGISPFVEEGAKTLPAYYLGADILVTHIAFGVIESCYDLLNSRKSYWAGISSIAGHGIFGTVTVGLIIFSSSVYIGFFGAVIIHIFWNAAVNRLAKKV